jgi:hypothetical protein
MPPTHRAQVEAMLAGAAAEHASLLETVPPAVRASLPVDAQGITEAIAYLARESGHEAIRAEQQRGHRMNAAVLHARVFGLEPLSRGTVLAAFFEGAQVRAEVLGHLAELVGGEALTAVVRELLPIPAQPPAGTDDARAVAELRALYARHEEAAVRIAAALDAG